MQSEQQNETLTAYSALRKLCEFLQRHEDDISFSEPSLDSWPSLEFCGLLDEAKEVVGRGEDELRIPFNIAEMIVQMEEACYSEGLGPDSEVLMQWIGKSYPELKSKYPHLQWGG